MQTTRLPDGSSSENPVTRTRRIIVVLAATVVLTLSGGPSTLTFAGSGPADDGAGASGPDALTRAATAALAATGGGRVTGTEVADEESWFEIEVTLDDGSQVDVQLDRSFTVVDRSADVGDPAENAG
jgi:hypothetical protein